MAVVYLGRDPAIDRLVAIKLLRESIDSVELRERFAREAKSAGRLRHPNIVTVFQVGVHEAAPFIIMEYIPGESLADIIRRQPPVTLTWKLRVIEDLCRGLSYAHKSGVIHRDMKPANIQIDSDGGVKILDFGIARLGEQKAGEQALTQLGMMMGTPNYMAPEQIDPGTADHRSDVFSVGLVLYELLTYQRAFAGDSYAVLHNILHNEPEALERCCPGIDSEVAEVVNRALAKAPEARYQDLAEMRDALRRIRTRLRAASHDTSDEGPVTVASDPSTEGDETRFSDRSTQVNRILAEAREAYQDARFDKTIERCERALELDASRTDASELKARAAGQIALAHARDLLAAGQEAYAAGTLDVAAEHIRAAGAIPRPGGEGATVQAQLAALARAVTTAAERQIAVRERLESARDLLRRGALDNAAQLTDEAFAMSPGNRDAVALRSEVRAAIDQERARQRAAEDAVTEARQRAERGEFGPAIALLSQHRPEHPLVTAALSDITALHAEAERRTADERKRHDHANAARAAFIGARESADRGDLAGAVRQIQAIRFGDPALASPALARLESEVDAFTARLEATLHLQDARAALAAGDLDAAAAGLARARQRDAHHPDATVVAADIERAQVARDRLSRARADLDRGELEKAAQLVEEVVAQAPGHRGALQLRDDVRKAIAQRDRALRKAADDAIASARGDAQRGEYAKAVARLKEHRPAHAAVTAALAEIVEQQSAAERRAADERRRQEHVSRAQAALRAARTAADHGDPAAALMQLQGIQFKGSDVASPALERLESEVDAFTARLEATLHLQDARAALAADDLDAAAAGLARARQRDAHHPDATVVAADIERAQVARDRISGARADLQRGELEKAAQLVEGVLAQAPGHRDALQLRDDVREAIAQRDRALRKAADDAIASARGDAQRGEYAKAVARLKEHRPAHAAVTAALAEIVEQQSAAERRAADERRRQEHVSRAQAALRAARAAADQGDPAAALMQLQGIQFTGKDVRSPALDALKTEAEALIASCEAAQHVSQQAPDATVQLPRAAAEPAPDSLPPTLVPPAAIDAATLVRPASPPPPLSPPLPQAARAEAPAPVEQPPTAPAPLPAKNTAATRSTPTGRANGTPWVWAGA